VTDPAPDPALDIDWVTLMSLIDSGYSEAAYADVARILNAVQLTENEIDALLKMPAVYRQRTAARLIEYGEIIREGSRTLDGQIMRLTGELV
jgi:hypothetical protein